jgi:hypothetical protein
VDESNTLYRAFTTRRCLSHADTECVTATPRFFIFLPQIARHFPAVLSEA